MRSAGLDHARLGAIRAQLKYLRFQVLPWRFPKSQPIAECLLNERPWLQALRSAPRKRRMHIRISGQIPRLPAARRMRGKKPERRPPQAVKQRQESTMQRETLRVDENAGPPSSPLSLC